MTAKLLTGTLSINTYKRRQAQCSLVTSLTADPGVTSLIRARSYTFVEIDHEIILRAILLLLVQEGLLSVTSEGMCTKYWLTA